MPDLDVQRLSAACRVAPVVLRDTTSTHDDLRALARDGAPHGASVLAEHQRAGRGRLGRRWQSPPGHNLLLSLLVRLPLPPDRVPLLCLAAAVAVAESAARIAPGVQIKWPNDVLSADGRKLAGILAEAEWAARGGALSFALIGIGLNVDSAPPLPDAACLAAIAGRALDRTAIAADLIERTLGCAEQLQVDPAGVLRRWRARSGTLGQRVRIGAVEGRAVDLDPDGALRVRLDDGSDHRVLAGDVQMIAAPPDR